MSIRFSCRKQDFDAVKEWKGHVLKILQGSGMLDTQDADELAEPIGKNPGITDLDLDLQCDSGDAYVHITRHLSESKSIKNMKISLGCRAARLTEESALECGRNIGAINSLETINVTITALRSRCSPEFLRGLAENTHIKCLEMTIGLHMCESDVDELVSHLQLMKNITEIRFDAWCNGSTVYSRLSKVATIPGLTTLSMNLGDPTNRLNEEEAIEAGKNIAKAFSLRTFRSCFFGQSVEAYCSFVDEFIKSKILRNVSLTPMDIDDSTYRNLASLIITQNEMRTVKSGPMASSSTEELVLPTRVELVGCPPTVADNLLTAYSSAMGDAEIVTVVEETVQDWEEVVRK